MCHHFPRPRRIDQSILTGESVSVLKDTDAVDNVDALNQDKTNLVFSGTNVASGKAVGIVVRTGSATELGAINQELSDDEGKKTPLKLKIEEFGDQLCKVIHHCCCRYPILLCLVTPLKLGCLSPTLPHTHARTHAHTHTFAPLPYMTACILHMPVEPIPS